MPIVLRPHRLYGTLAGAARPGVEVGDGVMAMMAAFAQLLSDHLSARLVDEAVRRAEQAEAQLRERVTYLAEAEHKLKTPLSIVSGWASTLVLDDVRLAPEHRQAGLEAIERNASLLVTEVGRMLEEAKAEMRTAELAVAPADATEVLETLTREFGIILDGHRVGYSCDGDVTAFVDRDALHQALAHLIDNAAKYSPASTAIDLSARPDGDWVVIEVADEGPGLPHDIDVFAPFQRGSDHAIRSVDGAGLGLHIVRKLVEAMGGHVEARRNPDRGSTFTVRVPAASSTVSG